MRLTVITAVRNAVGTIGECLGSVAGQRLRPEHWIIDGDSTDGTLDAVREWQGHPVRLLSEPDRGLYEAMNKGIARAQGDVIGILNADDDYADGEVLARVQKAFADPSVDACYGDLVYVRAEGGGQRTEDRGQRAEDRRQRTGNGVHLPLSQPLSQPLSETLSETLSAPRKLNGEALADRTVGAPSHRVTRYWRAGCGTSRSFYWGWMPPHPTFFVRRRAYEEFGGYRTDLGSAADYELMLRFLVKHELRSVYLPGVMVRMRVGGVSNDSMRHRWRANRMDRRAWQLNGLRPYPWTLLCKPLRKVMQWWVRYGPPSGSDSA